MLLCLVLAEVRALYFAVAFLGTEIEFHFVVVGFVIFCLDDLSVVNLAYS